MVSYFQIAVVLSFQGQAAWPNAFMQFIAWFSIFNFDFIPWQNLNCAVTLSFFSRVMVVGCLPVVIVLGLLSWFYLPFYFVQNHDLVDQLVKEQRKSHQNRRFIKLSLFTAFLLYPFVSRTILTVYNCIDVEGVSYLVADVSILCTAESGWEG